MIEDAKYAVLMKVAEERKPRYTAKEIVLPRGIISNKDHPEMSSIGKMLARIYGGMALGAGLGAGAAKLKGGKMAPAVLIGSSLGAYTGSGTNLVKDIKGAKKRYNGDVGAGVLGVMYGPRFADKYVARKKWEAAHNKKAYYIDAIMEKVAESIYGG